MTALGPSPLTSGNELAVDDARAAIAAAITPVDGLESLPVQAAVGRVLAEALVCPIDVPAHDNSAMDGYALHGGDLRPDGPTRLQAVAGTLLAGAPYPHAVARGHCLRIMTGAVMPPGLDTVVPLELCQAEDVAADGSGGVTIPPGTLRAGENRRRRGEDLAAGAVALAAGRVLRPADLGLAASLGFDRLTVRRRVRVAVFSTGDELCAPGTPLPPGGVYDSNRTVLLAALQRAGAEVLDLGLVRDDEDALAAALADAVARCDAVVTSGGVSMGDADHTRRVLARLGDVGFWKVAMRPGRPFAFGRLRSADGRAVALFGLPGNPVAALVTFHVLVEPALRRLAGADAADPPRLTAASAAPIRKRPGRTEYQRGIVERGRDGQWQVRVTGSQGAGVLRSLSEANALIVLGHDQGPVAAGDAVTVWLFDGLV